MLEYSFHEIGWNDHSFVQISSVRSTSYYMSSIHGLYLKFEIHTEILEVLITLFSE